MAPLAHRSPDVVQDHDRLLGETDLAMAAAAPISNHEINGGTGTILDITPGQKMLSATSGSLLTSLLVTPLDVVRVRLQSQQVPTSTVDFSKLAHTTASLTPAQTSNLGVTACCREVFFASNSAEYCIVAPRIDGFPSGIEAPHDCAVQEVRKKTYNSTFDGFRKIARNEGVTTLWRGLSPTLVMAVPANIIYFTGYDWLRYNQKSPFSRLGDDNAPLVAGSVARVLAATAVSPIELFRTRMQAAPSSTSTANHFMETLNGVREMVGSHGFTSLWRGLTLTLWRDVPFSGLYWWGYETIRAKLTDARDEREGRSRTRSASRSAERRRSQSRENHTETLVDSFAAGALSGAFASIVTTPFDVGKTRTQVYRDTTSRTSASGGVVPEERSMVRLLWHIFKSEGVSGLWRGWIPRTLKVAPACAIMISSYEVSKRVFRGVNERNEQLRQ